MPPPIVPAPSTATVLIESIDMARSIIIEVKQAEEAKEAEERPPLFRWSVLEGLSDHVSSPRRILETNIHIEIARVDADSTAQRNLGLS